MDLNLMKDFTSIWGFKIVDMESLREQSPEKFHPTGSMIPEIFESEIRPNGFVYVRRDVNSISFNLQKGPVKEVGVNGCNVSTVIATARLLLELSNVTERSPQKAKAAAKLNEALLLLSKDEDERQTVSIRKT